MRAALLTITGLLLLCAVPAGAQQLTLSTQLDYQLLDQRFRDPDEHITTSGFLPRVSLSLTGRVRPGSRLYLDLTGGLWQNTFGSQRQSDDTTRLVLRGEDPRYRLSLWHGTSRFTSTADGLDLTPTRIGANTHETGLTLILREPAWPVLNLQYSRSATESGLDSSSRTNSTASRINATYDLAPLRLRFDQSQLASDGLGSGGSKSTARRLGASFDVALVPKLSLFGDVQFSRSENACGATSVGGTTGRLASLRLSGAPTPKVALDLEVHSLLTDNLAGAASSRLTDTGASANMRSEVLPGLQLNVSRYASHTGRAGLLTDSSLTNVDLLAQIDSRNSAVISLSPSSFRTSRGSTFDQDNRRFSWTSQLDPQTDFSLTLDGIKGSSNGSELSRTTSKFATLRYRPDLQTTLGLSLFLNDSVVPGSSAETIRGIDTQFSWLPTSDLSLGCHLSLTDTHGAASSRITVPALDLRWQPDSRSSFSLNWRLQHALVRDLAVTGQPDLTTFATSFHRQLSRNSTLNVDYSLLKMSEGPLAYERLVRITITTGAGR